MGHARLALVALVASLSFVVIENKQKDHYSFLDNISFWNESTHFRNRLVRRQIQQEHMQPILNPPIPTSIGHYLGADQQIDSCVRDEVLVRGGCHRLLTRGPCAEDEYVLMDPADLKGFCAARLCGPDRIFVFSDQMCHDPRSSQLCPPGRQLYQSAYGTPVCQCPDGTYEGDDDLDDDVCDPLLGRTLSCMPDQVLWFRDFRSPPECLPDPCGGVNLNRGPNDLPFVPSAADGKCYQLGQRPAVCPAKTWYSLALETLRGVCQSLEEAGYQVFDEQTLAFLSATYGPFIKDASGTTAAGTPGQPGATGFPGQVRTMGQGFPGFAGAPGQAGTIGIPGQPGTIDQRLAGQPGTSGIPGQLGTTSQGFPGFNGFPGQAGTPGTPGSPAFSGQPGFTGIPGQPGLTGSYGTSSQGFPGFNGFPGQTGTPGTPGSPAFSGQPGFTGIPGQPGTTVTSGISSQGFPGFSGIPGQTGTPGTPGSPAFSGQPGTTGQGFAGQPGFTGTPGQPRTPGFSGQPGTPGITGQAGIPGGQGFAGQPGMSGQGFRSRPGTAGQPGQDFRGQSSTPGQPSAHGQGFRSQTGTATTAGRPGATPTTIQVGQGFPVGPAVTSGRVFNGQGFHNQGFDQRFNGQGFPGQSFPGQSFPGQTFPGQGFSGQGVFGQGAANTSGQAFAGQPGMTTSGHSQTNLGQVGTPPGFKQVTTLGPATSNAYITTSQTSSSQGAAPPTGMPQGPGTPRGGSHRGHPAHITSRSSFQAPSTSSSVTHLQPIGPQPTRGNMPAFSSSAHSQPSFVPQASPVLSPRMPMSPHGHMSQSGHFMPGFIISNEQQSLEMFGANAHFGRSMNSQQSFSDVSIGQPDLTVVMGDLLAHRSGLNRHNADLSFLQTSPRHPDHGFFNGVKTLMAGVLENPVYVQQKQQQQSQQSRQSSASTHHRARRSPLPHATPGNVFETRLLACRAGAQRDVNAKCRNTVLPAASPVKRNLRAVPPVPPSPGCPTGQAYDRRRRCVSTSDAVNSINAFNLGK